MKNRFFLFVGSLLVLLASAGCAQRMNSALEAERLSRTNQTEMAVKYANDAFSKLNTLSQQEKCVLTLAYFRLSDTFKARGDSARGNEAYERFLDCYGSSLSPDTALALNCYSMVNIHVVPMFSKFYHDSRGE